MVGSIHIGKIAGISIDINYSWLIIFVLLSFSLALSWFPAAYRGWPPAAYWIAGVVAALLLFVTVLVHELAHSLVARAKGIPVTSITLFIFGGVSNIEREPQSAGTEFTIAIVGPLTSLVLGAISWLVAGAVLHVNVYVSAILFYLGATNVLLGLFNLIPGFPLDGGRVLRAIIWGFTGSLQTATKWATRCGEGVAMLFILWGIVQTFALQDLFGGIWMVFIGWFLWQASRTENMQAQLESILKGVTVADVMSRAPVTVPGDVTVDRFVYDYALPHGVRAALVTQDGYLRGLITLTDVRLVSQDRWDKIPVRQVMVPASRLLTVTPSQNLNEVLPMMATHDVNQVPVVQNGHLVGVLDRALVMHYLETLRQAGGTPKQRPRLAESAAA